jgi:hypothetical protein
MMFLVKPVSSVKNAEFKRRDLQHVMEGITSNILERYENESDLELPSIANGMPYCGTAGLAICSAACVQRM